MAAEERTAGPQNLILENRRRLSVSGVTEVDSFDASVVRLRTALGALSVRGEELKIESLSVETGDLILSGKIGDLIYEELPIRSGLLSRLFG